jgi:hypothetical protein
VYEFVSEKADVVFVLQFRRTQLVVLVLTPQNLAAVQDRRVSVAYSDLFYRLLVRAGVHVNACLPRVGSLQRQTVLLLQILRLHNSYFLGAGAPSVDLLIGPNRNLQIHNATNLRPIASLFYVVEICSRDLLYRRVDVRQQQNPHRPRRFVRIELTTLQLSENVRTEPVQFTFIGQDQTVGVSRRYLHRLVLERQQLGVVEIVAVAVAELSVYAPPPRVHLSARCQRQAVVLSSGDLDDLLEGECSHDLRVGALLDEGTEA